MTARFRGRSVIAIGSGQAVGLATARRSAERRVPSATICRRDGDKGREAKMSPAEPRFSPASTPD